MTQPTVISNRYQLLDKLGQGGMGAVYRAYDRLEKTDVALKQVLIPDKDLDFGSKPGTDDSDRLRVSLAREFGILATLRHPHILSVLDFGFDGEGHPFYTMTLLEGGQDVKTFATNIFTGRRVKLIGQMLQALHYLHRRGVLHRDLKPDNVFVTRDEQVKVMDFGLAKLDRRSSTESGSLTGTLHYMAPELFKGERASVASDLFAVGVTVYEIMTGQRPFEAKTIGNLIMKIVTEMPDLSAIPPEFVPWLQRLLAKDPADRYTTAYDAMIAFYEAVGVDSPTEDHAIRESFLQASGFVGREAELKQLTTALHTLKDASAFFLIGGESGVGKSRLLDEFRIQALVKGATVIRGQGVEGGGLPFQLWRNVVRRMLLMIDVTDLQAGVLKDLVPDVSELLDRDIPDAPELTGKASQDRIVLTIVDLLRKVAQPLVLLLEDLHWAEQNLALLKQIFLVKDQLPSLMVVANYRDDEATDLPEKLAEMTPIKLERLTPDAVSELSTAMLGDVGMNDDVVNLLHSQSEGNLFFLVETVRALAESSGDLQRIGHGELPEGVLTGGMQAITRRRLSKVDPQYADIQTLAAVIGREIDTQLLAHAYDEASVNAWLSDAADYNVISIQDNAWRFAHDKLRETLIADIPDDEIPVIHRTAAETIEAVYPDDAGYNEALLRHWQQVGDFDKTYHYTLPVAKYMIQISGAYAKAESLLQSLLDHLPSDDARRVAPLNWLASSDIRQGNYDLGKTWATQAQQLATTHDDSLGRALSLNNLGMIAIQQGDYERAGDFYQQSLTISQDLGDQRLIASALNNFGLIAFNQGDYERAGDFYQQSLVIDHQLGDRHGIADSLLNIGNVATYQEDYERAEDFYQRSLVIRQELGDQLGIAISLNNFGMIKYKQGDNERAKDLLQQGVTLFKQLGHQYGTALSLHKLGQASHKQDHSTVSFFHESLSIAHHFQIVPVILLNVIGFAEHLIIQKQAQRAASLVGLVQGHPAQNSVVREALDEVTPLLEAALAPDDLAAALETGKSLDLDTVVAGLLAEFGSEANQ